MFRVIDLFSGCGGLSLGFQNSGFDIVAAYDHWEPAVEVYRLNFSHPIHSLNLSNKKSYSHIAQYQPQMIIGGPPCQDFSSAGLRDESLGRADLTYKYGEIISSIQPSMFLMENVERIQNSDVLSQTKELLTNSGYALTETVLNASLCGVPQNRKRYFLFGELDGQEDALLPFIEAHLSDKPMTVYDYLGNSLGIEHYYRHPRSYNRRGVFSIYEPSPTIRGVNRPVPGNYSSHPGDTAPVTENLRALTTLERSYIQTFPKDFIFEGTKTNLEQMIGNAVPVKQAELIAKSIIDYLNNGVVETIMEPKQLKLWSNR